MTSPNQLDDGYHLDLEQDYEAIYKNGFRPDPYSEGYIPVGMCSRLCTTEEMLERERQRRLSRYEIEPGSKPPRASKQLTMKEFTRSVMGREFTQAHNLRPWSVLRHGLHHLLLNICTHQDDWMFICDFVFDRLKAIRQDMIIQRIEGLRCVEVLEGSIRFLVYSMFRLTCTLKDYTEHQPFKVILSPEGTPVSGLNNYEVNVVREMKLTMQCLRDCLHSLIVQYQDHVPESPNRALFEAINLIANNPILHGHQYCGTKYQSKKELRNSDPMFRTVFKMYREHLAAYAPVIAQIQVFMIGLLKKLYATKGQNVAHPDHLCTIICPEWLDVNRDERLIFTIFMAIQFGIYDDDNDRCDFNLSRSATNVQQTAATQKKQYDSEGDNETRVYAMQMIAGREWSFFKEALDVITLEQVLNPSQTKQ